MNKKGLQGFLSDKPLALVTYRHWFFLAIIGLITFLILLWLIFGKVGIVANGEGIILPDTQGVFAISSKGAGIVESVSIGQGQPINKGQVLAILDQSEARVAIDAHKALIQVTQWHYKKIKALSDTQVSLASKLHTEKTRLLADYEKSYRLYTQYFENLMKNEQRLMKLGYISAFELEKIKHETSNLSLKLKEFFSNQTQSDINKYAAILAIEKSLADLKENIENQKAQLSIAERQYQEHKFIKSPESGVILSVNIAPGQYITSGQKGFTVTKGNLSANHFIAFFNPLTYSRLIKPGMIAYVIPSFLSEYQYGSISATIETIDRFPQSIESINAIVSNEALTQFVSNDNKPMLMANVKLMTDPQDASKYVWNAHGRGSPPPYAIPVGTLCHIKVLIEHRSPMSFILPVLRRVSRWDA
jgi:NHLM bacteriocin system secretion protein